MAHHITRKDNLFYVGEKPWHGIGKRVDGVLTASEAIIAADLGWKVNSSKIYDAEGNQVNGYQALKREDNGDVLQICKDSYKVVQNVDCFKIFDEVIGTGMAKYEIAGSLCGGKKVWMLAKLPFDFTVNGSDEIKSYITLINSHDGSLALQMYQTPVRVVCANTLRASLSNRENVCYARHTTSATRNFKERATVILESARQYFERFKVSAQAMARREMTQLDIETFITELFAVNPDAEEVSTRTKNQMERIESLIYQGIGNNGKTSWDCFNGVTQFIDHEYSTEENRLASSWLGAGSNMREKAYALLNR